MDKNQLQDFINGIGFSAETSLIFYRSLIKAGASPDEAASITRLLIEAILYGQNKTTSDQ